MLYEYPQSRIIPGAHFDYDAYWKERRGSKMGGLGRWQGKRAALAAHVIRQGGGTSVNDIGAGAGEVLHYIKNQVPLQRAVAYDSSQFALEFAESLGLETKQFDINKSSSGEIELADYTLLFEILEHIPGPEELLAECYKKSTKGVLFTFPNTGFFMFRFRLFFFGRFPLQWARHPGEHLRFWTRTDLLWWLKAQGYANYDIHYYVGIPLLKSLWPNMFAAGFFVELRK